MPTKISVTKIGLLDLGLRHVGPLDGPDQVVGADALVPTDDLFGHVVGRSHQEVVACLRAFTNRHRGAESANHAGPRGGRRHGPATP